MRAHSFGGERGIRTLDTGFGPYAPLAGECLRPLGHLSVRLHTALAPSQIAAGIVRVSPQGDPRIPRAIALGTAVCSATASCATLAIRSRRWSNPRYRFWPVCSLSRG